MWHKAIYALVLALLLACTLLLLPPDQARAQRHEGETQEVKVVNFPARQTVAGEVSVSHPIPSAALVELPETVALPAARNDTSQLVAAGTVNTAGWRHAVLSLTGELRGRGGAGEVGALLIPDVATVRDAFEDGRILFPLEVTAKAGAGDRWLASGQPEATVAFPRYRVYLYNTTQRSAAVRVYVYLTQ